MKMLHNHKLSFLNITYHFYLTFYKFLNFYNKLLEYLLHIYNKKVSNSWGILYNFLIRNK